MNLTKGFVVGTVLTAMAVSIMSPIAALASQQTKNDWRNLAGASAAVGVLGLATHNKTMAGAGLAGAAYSGYRYEQDRKHQAAHRRAVERRRLAERRHHQAMLHRAHRFHG
jgi:hypothetical protein